MHLYISYGILDLFKSHGKKELIYSPDNSISGIQNNEIILSSSWECSDFTRALGPTAKQEMTTLSLCIYSTVWVWALERKPPGACLYGHCEDCFFFPGGASWFEKGVPSKMKTGGGGGLMSWIHHWHFLLHVTYIYIYRKKNVSTRMKSWMHHWLVKSGKLSPYKVLQCTVIEGGLCATYGKTFPIEHQKSDSSFTVIVSSNWMNEPGSLMKKLPMMVSLNPNLGHPTVDVVVFITSSSNPVDPVERKHANLDDIWVFPKIMVPPNHPF